MSPAHPFEVKLAENWPPERWQSAGVLLAVSGGADSVALLRAMVALCGTDRKPLRVAHLNHHLRGAESDGDERFVSELSRTWGIPCDVERMDMAVVANEQGESLETASRTWRYDFLQRLAEQHGIGYVATAHTADDQVETILHRIVRGTGLTGLAGISRARALGPAVTLLRPLLAFRRAEVMSYLQTLAQPYRQDSSNEDRQYTRNHIRHELLPLLRQQYNASVDDALLRLGSLANEMVRQIEPMTQRLREEAVRQTSAGGVIIDCDRLQTIDSHLVREMLIAEWAAQGWPRQAMGFAQWECLREMVQNISGGESTARVFPGGILARRDASKLTLARN